MIGKYKRIASNVQQKSHEEFRIYLTEVSTEALDFERSSFWTILQGKIQINIHLIKQNFLSWFIKANKRVWTMDQINNGSMKDGHT